MPKCHKIYPNCIWHVPSEWHGLNFDTALLTKVYWNYTTHIVRVCLSHKHPINPDLPFTTKSNLQVHFGSKAMASLYDLLCYHSLSCRDPLLEELIAYPLLAFLLIFLITLPTNTPRTKHQSIQLTHLFLNSTLMIRLTFLRYFLPYFVFFLCNSKIFTTRTAGRDIQKGRRPRTADDPQEGPEALDN